MRKAKLLTLFLLIFFASGCAPKPPAGGEYALPLGKYRHDFYGGGYNLIELKDSNKFVYQKRVSMFSLDESGTYTEDRKAIYLTTFEQPEEFKYRITYQSIGVSHDSVTLYIYDEGTPLVYVGVFECAERRKGSLASSETGFVSLAKKGTCNAIALTYLDYQDAVIPRSSLVADTVQIRLRSDSRRQFYRNERFRVKDGGFVSTDKWRLWYELVY